MIPSISASSTRMLQTRESTPATIQDGPTLRWYTLACDDIPNPNKSHAGQQRARLPDDFIDGRRQWESFVTGQVNYSAR